VTEKPSQRQLSDERIDDAVQSVSFLRCRWFHSDDRYRKNNRALNRSGCTALPRRPL